MSSIYQVFCEDKERERDILVGSVKANIGHLESTSGLAGLLKTILILQKGQVPQVLDFQTPKPSLRLDERPIKIPLETTALVPDDHHGPVRVSVNGFGYGGTNAHLILEAAPEPGAVFTNGHALTNGNGLTNGQGLVNGNGLTNGHYPATNGQHKDGSTTSKPDNTRHPHLFVLSAASEDSLRKSAAKLQAWATTTQPTTTQLRDLSYTLLARRTHHTHRAAVIASTASELIDEFSRVTVTRSKDPSDVQLTFVFTGQGAQWYAMGRELLAASETFRKSIVKSTELLTSWGWEWNLLDELMRDKEESRLGISELAQPATTALQIALVDLLDEMGVKPQAVCGHSSGEIGAGYACGALTAEAALRM